jgi:hypothetical protein
LTGGATVDTVEGEGLVGSGTAGRRIRTEQRTVRAMIEIDCQTRHPGGGGPCAECEALFAYAEARLDKCPYGDDKPACRVCPIHCYRPAEREAMRGVMRRAGPRMLWRHPFFAIRHLWLERFGSTPEGPPRRRLRADGSGGR